MRNPNIGRKISELTQAEKDAKRAIFTLLDKLNAIIADPNIKGIPTAIKTKNEVETALASLRGVFNVIKDATMNNELS